MTDECYPMIRACSKSGPDTFADMYGSSLKNLDTRADGASATILRPVDQTRLESQEPDTRRQACSVWERRADLTSVSLSDENNHVVLYGVGLRA